LATESEIQYTAKLPWDTYFTKTNPKLSIQKKNLASFTDQEQIYDNN